MEYRSTRGVASATPKNFLEILLAGLAEDGGLYLPSSYPKVSSRDLAHWRHLSYADLAYEIISRFAPDIPDVELARICRQTYTPEVFCNAREGDDAQQIVPLHRLGAEGGAPVSLLALSNGPTLAFKDMAMQLLGNLMEYALRLSGERLNVLGATSGDTGSAAEYALRGKKGVKVFMLSPHGRMSAFQTAQMFSLQDPNIFNLAADGVFDDCQDIVKAVSNDLAFKAKHRIGTVNSINWARVVAQVVYYFKGWFLATQGMASDQKVSFAVPSGNFGNVCAGHIARQMGLPIHQLVVATNENDVLDEFFRTGVYRPRASKETHHTSSPSMDISKASNFERFIYDVVGQDSTALADLWQAVETGRGFTLGADTMQRIRDEFGFVSGKSTHTDRLATIKAVFEQYGVVVDPHTADGLKAAREHLTPGVPMVVLETAQPAKFELVIQEALNQTAPRPPGFEDLEALPQRSQRIPADARLVQDLIAENDR